VAVHYGATSGPHDCYPLDWGAVTPLWFLGGRFASQPRTAIAVPSRLLPLDAFVRFGRAIADAATDTQRRVALVASADLAHAHAADGPYGFDPAAARFDDWLADAIKAGDLARLEHADMELVAAAVPDGLWQILVLAGALQRVPMLGEFLSYERPTYYGMLCAAYEPV
jgi:aromatic ring-opening dioxygenase LigB subunit